MRAAGVVVILAMIAGSSCRADECQSFSASTMKANGAVAVAKWRTDYPSMRPNPGDSQPWEAIDFRAKPADYMNAVLGTAKTSFKIVDRKLVGTGQEEWYISQWLDYGNSGREPLMGLTKERSPDAGDLSKTNTRGSQVWAVGFYNKPGAAVFGEIFSDPCNPSLPVALKFPNDTVSVKFLFTDAKPEEVTYLQGAPEYDAFIDPPNPGAANTRVIRTLRLLQVDISVKDSANPRRAQETGWVFGTFVWLGPPKGDTLFDNLVPVSLQWGNDPGVYDTTISQGWTNPDLRGVTYGWDERPTMGFNGRANGPADNIRSSCLSCHGAARTPRASIGLLGSSFKMSDLSDAAKVKAHVDTWFQNIKAGQLFQSFEPAVSALDYSLQLEAAVLRMCQACQFGDLRGPTPNVCRSGGFYNRPVCNAPIEASVRERLLSLVPPPRQ
ncbi:hypothetical protein JQ596_09225 [Bradyrhizobium manausense]|uniref:hypothetical protein n=1 Tax=Bradyrhizobium TaxID=374 RepID=UPI001BABEB54|nr:MULTISPECIES: hypothetical protein [Bradyrhizobium]MBR0825718.1 hypothetical protein [Bradyrhizobium manausense]UVO31335.1 hypothetical protein KUF59_12125 [Bradyrhizobium arachidis]